MTTMDALDAPSLTPRLLTGDDLVDELGDAYAGDDAALVIEHRLDGDIGIVITGNLAALADALARIRKALGLPDTEYCPWCEEAESPTYQAHEGHDKECPLQ